jgi:hypothetical protein
MASRFPIVLDTDSGRLRELPSGDDLSLSGNNITGLLSLTTTGGITVGGTLNVSGTANADTVAATTANVTTLNATTILIGGQPISSTQVQSDFNEANTLSAAFIKNKPAIPEDVADLTDDQNLLSGGFSGDYNDLTNLPSIPSDIQQLSDNNNLIPDDIQDLTDNSNLLVSAFTDLSDTADNYTGQADKLIVVNSGATGIGFTGVDELAITSGQVTGALGFTPYDGATNSNNYINAGFLNGTGDITYDETTGEISFNNASGYLTSETDTLDSVTGRGGTTTNNISVGNFTTTGITNTGTTEFDGNFTGRSTGTLIIDVNSAGVPGTLQLGNSGNVALASTTRTTTSSPITPATNGGTSLGESSLAYSNVYANTITVGSVTPTGTSMNVGSTSSGFELILDGDRVEIGGGTSASLKIKEMTRATMTGKTAELGDIVYNNSEGCAQMYIPSFNGTDGNAWVQLTIPFGGTPDASADHEGMFAVANGVDWDPLGDGSIALVVRLGGTWYTVNVTEVP